MCSYEAIHTILSTLSFPIVYTYKQISSIMIKSQRTIIKIKCLYVIGKVLSEEFFE